MEGKTPISPQEQKIETKRAGDTVTIFSPQGEKITLTILKVGSSAQEAALLGIGVTKDIPIYYLDKNLLVVQKL